MTALRRPLGGAVAVVAVLFGLSIVGPGLGGRAAVPLAGRATGIAAAAPSTPSMAARGDDERASTMTGRVKDRLLGACGGVVVLVIALSSRRRHPRVAGAAPWALQAGIAVRGPPTRDAALL